MVKAPLFTFVAWCSVGRADNVGLDQLLGAAVPATPVATPVAAPVAENPLDLSALTALLGNNGGLDLSTLLGGANAGGGLDLTQLLGGGGIDIAGALGALNTLNAGIASLTSGLNAMSAAPLGATPVAATPVGATPLGSTPVTGEAASETPTGTRVTNSAAENGAAAATPISGTVSQPSNNAGSLLDPLNLAGALGGADLTGLASNMVPDLSSLTPDISALTNQLNALASVGGLDANQLTNLANITNALESLGMANSGLPDLTQPLNSIAGLNSGTDQLTTLLNAASALGNLNNMLGGAGDLSSLLNPATGASGLPNLADQLASLSGLSDVVSDFQSLGTTPLNPLAGANPLGSLGGLSALTDGNNPVLAGLVNSFVTNGYLNAAGQSAVKLSGMATEAYSYPDLANCLNGMTPCLETSSGDLTLPVQSSLQQMGITAARPEDLVTYALSHGLGGRRLSETKSVKDALAEFDSALKKAFEAQPNQRRLSPWDDRDPFMYGGGMGGGMNGGMGGGMGLGMRQMDRYPMETMMNRPPIPPQARGDFFDVGRYPPHNPHERRFHEIEAFGLRVQPVFGPRSGNEPQAPPQTPGGPPPTEGGSDSKMMTAFGPMSPMGLGTMGGMGTLNPRMGVAAIPVVPVSGMMGRGSSMGRRGIKGMLEVPGETTPFTPVEQPGRNVEVQSLGAPPQVEPMSGNGETGSNQGGFLQRRPSTGQDFAGVAFARDLAHGGGTNRLHDGGMHRLVVDPITGKSREFSGEGSPRPIPANSQFPELAMLAADSVATNVPATKDTQSVLSDSDSIMDELTKGAERFVNRYDGMYDRFGSNERMYGDSYEYPRYGDMMSYPSMGGGYGMHEFDRRRHLEASLGNTAKQLAAAHKRRLSSWLESSFSKLVDGLKDTHPTWKDDMQSAADNLATALSEVVDELKNGSLPDRLETFWQEYRGNVTDTPQPFEETTAEEKEETKGAKLRRLLQEFETISSSYYPEGYGDFQGHELQQVGMPLLSSLTNPIMGGFNTLTSPLLNTFGGLGGPVNPLNPGAMGGSPTGGLQNIANSLTSELNNFMAPQAGALNVGGLTGALQGLGLRRLEEQQNNESESNDAEVPLPGGLANELGAISNIMPINNILSPEEMSSIFPSLPPTGVNLGGLGIPLLNSSAIPSTGNLNDVTQQLGGVDLGSLTQQLGGVDLSSLTQLGGIDLNLLSQQLHGLDLSALNQQLQNIDLSAINQHAQALTADLPALGNLAAPLGDAASLVGLPNVPNALGGAQLGNLAVSNITSLPTGLNLENLLPTANELQTGLAVPSIAQNITAGNGAADLLSGLGGLDANTLNGLNSYLSGLGLSAPQIPQASLNLPDLSSLVGGANVPHESDHHEHVEKNEDGQISLQGAGAAVPINELVQSGTASGQVGTEAVIPISGYVQNSKDLNEVDVNAIFSALGGSSLNLTHLASELASSPFDLNEIARTVTNSKIDWNKLMNDLISTNVDLNAAMETLETVNLNSVLTTLGNSPVNLTEVASDFLTQGADLDLSQFLMDPNITQLLANPEISSLIAGFMTLPTVPPHKDVLSASSPDLNSLLGALGTQLPAGMDLTGLDAVPFNITELQSAAAQLSAHLQQLLSHQIGSVSGTLAQRRMLQAAGVTGRNAMGMQDFYGQQVSAGEASAFDNSDETPKPVNLDVDVEIDFVADDSEGAKGSYTATTEDLGLDWNFTLETALVPPLMACWNVSDLSADEDDWPSFMVSNAQLELVSKKDKKVLNAIDLVYTEAENLFLYYSPNWNKTQMVQKRHNYGCTWVPMCVLQDALNRVTSTEDSVGARVTIKAQKVPPTKEVEVPKARIVVRGIAERGRWAPIEDQAATDDLLLRPIAEIKQTFTGSPLFAFELPKPQTRPPSSPPSDTQSAISGYAVIASADSSGLVWEFGENDWNWIPQRARNAFALIVEQLKAFDANYTGPGTAGQSDEESDDADYEASAIAMFNAKRDLPIRVPEFTFVPRIVLEASSAFGLGPHGNIIQRCLPMAAAQSATTTGADPLSAAVLDLIYATSGARDTAIRMKSYLEAAPLQAVVSSQDGHNTFDMRPDLIENYKDAEWTINVSLSPLQPSVFTGASACMGTNCDLHSSGFF